MTSAEAVEQEYRPPALLCIATPAKHALTRRAFDAAAARSSRVATARNFVARTYGFQTRRRSALAGLSLRSSIMPRSSIGRVFGFSPQRAARARSSVRALGVVRVQP